MPPDDRRRRRAVGWIRERARGGGRRRAKEDTMTKRRRPLVTGARLTGAPVERLVRAAAYLGETHPSVEVRRAMQALRLAESDDARSVTAALPADLADWNAVIAAFRRAGVDGVAIGAAE
jgi:hypothetical protein